MGLKLTIELVPSTCWYSNMRKVLSGEQWDRLRRTVYKQWGYKCGICRADGMIHCHEIWHYNDTSHVQTLTGFIALCPMCHHVKHIGLAELLASKGELDIESVIQHFMKVNNCGRSEFYMHRAKSFRVWAERSNHEWVTDLGGYDVQERAIQV